MPQIAFTVVEYDPTRPWIVIGQHEETVDIEPAEFWAWALKRYPQARFKVIPEPGWL